MIRYSIVIPAFNEARRPPPYLEEVAGFCAGRGEPYEIVVVADGSTDGTGAVVEAAPARHPAVRLFTAAAAQRPEAAVNWADQEGSKVGVLTSGPGMLRQIPRARRR